MNDFYERIKTNFNEVIVDVPDSSEFKSVALVLYDLANKAKKMGNKNLEQLFLLQTMIISSDAAISDCVELLTSVPKSMVISAYITQTKSGEITKEVLEDAIFKVFNAEEAMQVYDALKTSNPDIWS